MTGHPCDYCGTPLDEDDREESFAPAQGGGRTTHFAAVCRERVHAALLGTKANLRCADYALTVEHARAERYEAALKRVLSCPSIRGARTVVSEVLAQRLAAEENVFPDQKERP
jgi:hypothetical protein